MSNRKPDAPRSIRHSRLMWTLASVVVIIISVAPLAVAQHSFSRTYPARKNVRLDVTNRTGAVTVTGWDRNEIKVTASIESPAARVTPEVNDEGLMIDVVSANRGRGDVGSVNFNIFVPFDSTVDIETRLGDIRVTDVQGQSVRAHVSSSGDIALVNINSASVMAESTSGQIFFDGELLAGGTYKFSTVEGDINI
ncbi:MAG TPA: DUF4097 family beta strand repeat-containing protein, partial [Pyrinomonadaceae bacterium]|nr:DUF4097 family beta strand repeat-containing protein [Pyrinomonadaceae bacterium]